MPHYRLNACLMSFLLSSLAPSFSSSSRYRLPAYFNDNQSRRYFRACRVARTRVKFASLHTCYSSVVRRKTRRGISHENASWRASREKLRERRIKPHFDTRSFSRIFLCHNYDSFDSKRRFLHLLSYFYNSSQKTMAR